MAILEDEQQLSMSIAADTLDWPVERDHTKPHVSELINIAARVTGQAPSYSDVPTQEGWNIMALGRIAEYCLRPIIHEEAAKRNWLFKMALVKEEDGIIGSLDGELHSYQGIEAIVEMKSKHSSPSDPTENWRYMAQCKAYCYLSGCNTAWMPILYLPRRGPPNAELFLYTITYTDDEIDSNWAMLKNCRKEKTV